jgi:hypothetical protein
MSISRTLPLRHLGLAHEQGAEHAPPRLHGAKKASLPVTNRKVQACREMTHMSQNKIGCSGTMRQGRERKKVTTNETAEFSHRTR